jgi:nucleotide-binding universal stress UspA family protein
MTVVLVATDGSEGGGAAVKAAAAMASRHGAALVVLTVVPRRGRSGAASRELAEFARVEHLGGDEAEAMGLVAEDILAEAKAIAEAQGCLRVSCTSRVGDPASEILACARQHSADILVLGSRGLGPLGAFALGSVSRKVADAAPCPVSIIPDQK